MDEKEKDKEILDNLLAIQPKRGRGRPSRIQLAEEGKKWTTSGPPVMQLFKNGQLIPRDNYEIKFLKEITKQARGMASASLKTLHSISEFGITESARVNAAKEILNRAIGTPQQHVKVSQSRDYATELRDLAQLLNGDEQEIEAETDGD